MGMYAPCFGKIGMTMQGLKLLPDQGKLERILTSLQASKDTSSQSIVVPLVLLTLFLTACEIMGATFEALWGPSFV